MTRDEFAARVYLQLLEAYGPTKDQQWILDEANRRADDFYADLKRRNPQKNKRRQVEHLQTS